MDFVVKKNDPSEVNSMRELASFAGNLADKYYKEDQDRESKIRAAKSKYKTNALIEIKHPNGEVEFVPDTKFDEKLKTQEQFKKIHEATKSGKFGIINSREEESKDGFSGMHAWGKKK